MSLTLRCTISAREAAAFEDAQWWSIDDLEAAQVQTLPNRLLEFLPDIIAGNMPAEPIDISPAKHSN